MILFNGIAHADGSRSDHAIESQETRSIDASGLLLLPAAIDAHVHFRVPGAEHKEDWTTGAPAAIAGGVTTVLDMPNNTPAITSPELLAQKKEIIGRQLSLAGIPLRYHLYLGANTHTSDELGQFGHHGHGDLPFIGIKVFLGQSTGTLLMDDPDAFRKLCRRAGELDILVAVHAEDDRVLRSAMEARKKNASPIAVREHSSLRPREAARAALSVALEMAEAYGTRMHILHISTTEEAAMIRDAKRRGLPVSAETTPHHLFLDERAYETLGTLAQMNPPLRTREDRMALWEAILDGTIDTVGTDHAPHTREEKSAPYGEAPSGVPGIETMLPLLLTAHEEGKISLERVIDVTRRNVEKIFRLPANDDVVAVDMNKKKRVNNAELKTKCGWSPFDGWELTGWPAYTVCSRRLFSI